MKLLKAWTSKINLQNEKRRLLLRPDLGILHLGPVRELSCRPRIIQRKLTTERMANAMRARGWENKMR